MNRCRAGGLLLAAAFLIVSASSGFAQTTGRIFGQLVDLQGAVVPGATVTISSPSLQGTQTQVTDDQGNFRFPSVPPGRYMLRAEMSGFKTVEQPNIEVGLDRTVTLTLKMEIATVAETVTVQGASPVVDTTSTVTGVNAGTEQFNRLAVRRDFYSIARLAPGTSEDTVGTVVYGSTGSENQYIIDGLNTTGVERSERGKTLNFDFVQEVEVKTGGLPAEYGRMTGGIVNVITKSGSNTFHGSVFGFGEGGGLQSDDKTREKRPETTTTVNNVSHLADGGGELGGFIARDKLWFFGAYNRVDQGRDTIVIRPLLAGSPALDSAVPQSTTRDLWAIKLTAKGGTGQTVHFSVFGDPSTIDGALSPYFPIAGPENTWKGTRETGGNDFVGKYEGVFGSDFLLQVIGARHKEQDVVDGPGASIPLLTDATVSPNLRTGGFGFFEQKEFSRDQFKADATKFVAGHEIKGGADYEHVKAIANRYNGGAGQSITKFVSGGTVYYRHRFYVDDTAAGFDRGNSRTWTIAVPLLAEPDSRNVSFYAQDSWKVAAGASINFGIRWEGQDVRNRDNESAFKLNKNWAPRVGFVWDVARNNRSKLYANWGRFYESVPMDINIRSFGGEQTCFCYNFSPDPANIVPDAAAPRRSSLLGGATPVDPDLKGQYIDEWLAGFEYELGSNIVLGAKVTRRDLGRVIEDFLIPSAGEYFIANPSKGVGAEMGFYDLEHTAPAPKAQRKMTAFEINGRKRFTNNWQLIASAVFSRLEGNYDGTFQVSTGQLDPNINSAFDYADFLVNADGKLSNDRVAQIKFDGSYEFTNGPKGLNLGLSTRILSGLPLNAYGYSFGYSNWEYYLVPRGSLGRGPTDWEADLHVAYPIRLGANVRLNAIADVFNLFDRQAINVLDERYNLNSDDFCAGIPEALCASGGGIATVENTLTPLGTISNPRATASNPDYLKAGSRFTGQRSIRLGVRVTF